MMCDDFFCVKFAVFTNLFFQTGDFIPTQIKVGDKVLLPEYGGTRVELEENKEYHLFRESDILAKLEV